MQQQHLLTSVKAAIYALYHPNEQPVQHAQADSYLREFSLTNEAWEICSLLILQSQNFEERFFGAQILSLKLNQQWSSLPNKQQKNQIKELIIRAILVSPSIKITEKLCMCLAIWTVKMLEADDQELDTRKLFGFFSLPNAKLDFTSDSPNGQSLTNGVHGVYYIAQPFLIWLSCIAEQVDPRHLSNYQFSKLCNQLSKTLEDILKFCMSAITSSKNVATQKLALRCIKKWVEYGLPYSYIFHENSILDLAFQCLEHGALFEDSIALMEEIFSQRPKPEYNHRVKIYMMKLIGLSPFYEKSLKSGMFDICRELVKLAVTFGESHILLIASADPECLQLVKFICACVRNPEKEIVELTFDFWYSLKCQLTNNYPQNKDIFKPIFADVATILISHCRLPVVQNGEEIDEEELEELTDFRKEAADVLVNVYELLFADYFNLCLNGIKQGYLRYQHDKQKWQLIESSLFAIVCVSDCVKEEQAANLTPIIRMFNEMPSDIHDIRRIQVQVLGSYAHWVGKQSEDFISHSINFALQSIWQFTHKVNASYRTAAVNAFCALCEKCEKAVATNHSLATNLIQTCLSKIDLIPDPNIQIKVYEGMSHLVVSVNNDLNLQLQLMQSILQAVFTRIKAYNSVVNENNAKLLVIELKRLKATMKAFDGDRGIQTLLAIMQYVWSLLRDTMVKYKLFGEVVDNFCRLFECMICSMGVHSETLDFMNKIALFLYELYYELPYPYLLRTVNIITYGQNADSSVCKSLSANYINICRKTFENCNFMENDELIMEFFKLQHSIIKSHPYIFFGREDVVEAILDQAVMCIQYRNAEVTAAIVKFLCGFLEFDLSKHKQYEPMFIELLKHISPKLIPAVLNTVLFEEHPASRDLVRILHAYRHFKRFLTTYTDNFIRYDTSIPSLQNVPQVQRDSFANSLAVCTTMMKMKAAVDNFKKMLK
jgi:hypothetical protein